MSLMAIASNPRLTLDNNLHAMPSGLDNCLFLIYHIFVMVVGLGEEGD